MNEFERSVEAAVLLEVHERALKRRLSRDAFDSMAKRGLVALPVEGKGGQPVYTLGHHLKLGLARHLMDLGLDEVSDRVLAGAAMKATLLVGERFRRGVPITSLALVIARAMAGRWQVACIQSGAPDVVTTAMIEESARSSSEAFLVKLDLVQVANTLLDAWVDHCADRATMGTLDRSGPSS